MPAEIPETLRSAGFIPLLPNGEQFEHPVWFGIVPGSSNAFAVVEHETGNIWLLTRKQNDWSRSLLLCVGRFHRGTRGLLGMAFHPGFAENRRYFIARHMAENGRFATLVFEYEATVDLQRDSGKPPRILLRFDETTNVHYGGGLAFGPDGYFYIGMGDSGPQEDPNGHGQDTTRWLGKLLRIDVDHRSGERSYSIPADNPFRDRSDFRPEIWAYGFREPWRFSFDTATGDLWVGDVGQDRYEEVDIVRRGENHGWNVYEGFEPFSNQFRRPSEVFTAPVFAYPRKYGPSVTGGFVYRGDSKSPLHGAYIFGDYESKRVWALTQQDRQLKLIRQIGRCPQRVVSFGEDWNHELYVVGYEGTVYKLDLTAASFP
jgi:glucose/arabinose dehydrogenase